MSPIIITIIGAVLGSAGMFAFLQFLINRHDQRKDAVEDIRQKHDQDVKVLRQEFHEKNEELRELLYEIKEQTIKNERDNVRTQLLVLMADYQDDTSELMHCAEHYFKDLEGNWYATPLFAKFLREKGIAAPEWLLNK